MPTDADDQAVIDGLVRAGLPRAAVTPRTAMEFGTPGT